MDDLEKSYQQIIRNPEYLDRICKDVIISDDPDVRWYACSDCNKIIVFTHGDKVCDLCIPEFDNKFGLKLK